MIGKRDAWQLDTSGSSYANTAHNFQAPSSSWKLTLETLDQIIEWAQKESIHVANNDRKNRYEDWKNKFLQEVEKVKRAIFQQIKDPYTAPASTLFDKKNGGYTSNVDRMHQCLHEEWSSILDQHRDREDKWNDFETKNSEFFPQLEKMKDILITGEMLHEAIKSTNPGTSAGSDGWKPGELRWLPRAAWDARAIITNAMLQGKGTPTSFNHAYMTAIPKKGKDLKPLNQRMLTIFTALYRLETKTMFLAIRKQFMDRLHPSLYGGVGGKEALEAAWDSQLDLEEALVCDLDLTCVTVNCKKNHRLF